MLLLYNHSLLYLYARFVMYRFRLLSERFFVVCRTRRVVVNEVELCDEVCLA